MFLRAQGKDYKDIPYRWIPEFHSGRRFWDLGVQPKSNGRCYLNNKIFIMWWRTELMTQVVFWEYDFDCNVENTGPMVS